MHCQSVALQRRFLFAIRSHTHTRAFLSRIFISLSSYISRSIYLTIDLSVYLASKLCLPISIYISHFDFLLSSSFFFFSFLFFSSLRPFLRDTQQTFTRNVTLCISSTLNIQFGKERKKHWIIGLLILEIFYLLNGPHANKVYFLFHIFLKSVLLWMFLNSIFFLFVNMFLWKKQDALRNHLFLFRISNNIW